MKDLTALCVVLGIFAAFFLGCETDNSATQPDLAASHQALAHRSYSDDQRLEAISYSTKTDPPVGFTDTSWRCWSLSYNDRTTPYWLAWYTCSQASPMLVWQRYYFSYASLRDAIDGVLVQLWFEPSTGQDADKARMDWICGCAEQSYYNDLQVSWQDYLPPVAPYASSFWVLNMAHRPPEAFQQWLTGPTPRAVIDASMKKVGQWR